MPKPQAEAEAAPTPPQMTAENLADGQTVTGSVDWRAHTIGPVARVEFAVDGTVIATSTAEPWATTWDTIQRRGRHARARGARVHEGRPPRRPDDQRYCGAVSDRARASACAAGCSTASARSSRACARRTPRGAPERSPRHPTSGGPCRSAARSRHAGPPDRAGAPRALSPPSGRACSSSRRSRARGRSQARRGALAGVGPRRSFVSTPHSSGVRPCSRSVAFCALRIRW